jgi:hypothetical protein
VNIIPSSNRAEALAPLDVRFETENRYNPTENDKSGELPYGQDELELLQQKQFEDPTLARMKKLRELNQRQMQQMGNQPRFDDNPTVNTWATDQNDTSV